MDAVIVVQKILLKTIQKGFKSMIEWNKLIKSDSEIISKIVDRIRSSLKNNLNNDYLNSNLLDIEMDIIAAHIKNPLNLKALLEADKFNFYHDIAGINVHIDRESGEMKDHFVPRFTLKQ
jgi:hypothetical protein